LLLIVHSVTVANMHSRPYSVCVTNQLSTVVAFNWFNHVPDIYICKRCWSAGSVVSVVCGKKQSLKTRYLMNAGYDTLSSRPWTRLWIIWRTLTKQKLQFLESHSLLQNKIHLLLAGNFQKLYCAFRFVLYLWSTY